MRLGLALIGALWVALACGPYEADAAASADAAADSIAAEPRGFDAPTWVMVRSALIPGWGQAKNGAWWKALLVAGIEGAFLERIAFEDRRVQVYRERAAAAPEGSERDALQSKVRRHLGHRRDFTWWTACLLVLSLADAYVDAHLRHFDVRLDGLPDDDDAPGAGPPAAPLPESDGDIGLRIGLRLAG